MNQQKQKNKKPLYPWIILVLILGILTVWYVSGKNVLESFPEIESPKEKGENMTITKEQQYEEELLLVVLESKGAYWESLLGYNGYAYQPPQVEFFSGLAPECSSPRNFAGSIYCPQEQVIYLERIFFDRLFKQSPLERNESVATYVIAHQLGFHIQNILEITQNIETLKKEEPDREKEFFIREELQAGCFVGMWAHSMKGAGVLDRQDVASGMRIIKRLQDEAVFDPSLVRDRLNWFNVGYKDGDFKKCNTFKKREWPRIRSIR